MRLFDGHVRSTLGIGVLILGVWASAAQAADGVAPTVATVHGKSVVVRINGRGPKQANRIRDITPRAARALGIGKFSMAEVTLESVN